MNENFVEAEHGWHKAHAKGYNKYKHTYATDYCRSTGLPMFSKKNFPDMESRYLYTRSRAEKESVAIDTAKVCGWYRVMYGYVPIYSMKPFESLTDSEFRKSVSSFVRYNHPDLLNILLESGRSVSLIGKSIDKLISKTIETGYHECYTILLNWKNEHDLYVNPLDKLKL